MRNQTATTQDRHSPRSTAPRQKRASLRFRKAWLLALIGGFFVAWGTQHWSKQVLEALNFEYGNETHLAAPTSGSDATFTPRNTPKNRKTPFENPAPCAPNDATQSAGN